jgi:hypothetical protein
VFNEIEETVVAALRHEQSGLPSDDEASWYVPAAHIGRMPPDLRGNLSAALPAVSFAVSEFDVIEEEFAGIGECEKVEQGLKEIHGVKFDILYHLEVWATEPDRVNAISQQAIEILLRERDRIEVQGDDYRLLRMRPRAGRDVPIELEHATVFRRQLDYRVESELLIETLYTPIEGVVIEEIGWQVDEE